MSTKRSTDMVNVKSALCLCLLLGPLGSAVAEHHVYRTTQSVPKTITQVVDALGAGGFQFTVTHVFNEERDGKQGFVFLLQPRRTYCEISFFQDGAESVVRVATQDEEDEGRFRKLFEQDLHMTEKKGKP